MKQLHKLSPVFDAAMSLKVTSHSPSMRSPVSSLGRFAFEQHTTEHHETNMSGASSFTTEEPKMMNTSSIHQNHRRGLSSLVIKPNKNKPLSRTAPTPDLQKLSPSRARTLFAFGDTYEYILMDGRKTFNFGGSQKLLNQQSQRQHRTRR